MRLWMLFSRLALSVVSLGDFLRNHRWALVRTPDAVLRDSPTVGVPRPLRSLLVEHDRGLEHPRPETRELCLIRYSYRSPLNTP